MMGPFQMMGKKLHPTVEVHLIQVGLTFLSHLGEVWFHHNVHMMAGSVFFFHRSGGGFSVITAPQNRYYTRKAKSTIHR